MKLSVKVKAFAVAGIIAVSSAQPAHAVDLAGSGASFAVPIIEACKAGFAKKTGHSYVYTSTGSGTGKNNSDNKIGDFWFLTQPTLVPKSAQQYFTHLSLQRQLLFL